MKRTVPSGAAKEYADSLRESLRRDDEVLQQRGEKLASVGGVEEVRAWRVARRPGLVSKAALVRRWGWDGTDSRRGW